MVAGTARRHGENPLGCTWQTGATDVAWLSNKRSRLMRTNQVKRKLAAGAVSIGTMVFEFGSTGIGRIMGQAGADFVVYDMEHSGWSIETIRNLMATTRSADIVPLVRVPATQYHLMSRPLDVGAMGLMIPMVESVEQAKLIAQSVKYPPLGRRGSAFGFAHDDYAPGDVNQKMESANQEVLTMAQIETKDGVDNVEAIAAVDGIDVLWIGHFDLSVSLGVPAQFEHPLYMEAVERVLAAANNANKVAGIMTGGVAIGREQLAQGFRMMAYSGDVMIYGEALRQGLDALRQPAKV
ncbi:MAG: aldolase/citrate lyase family protein [Chloroflexota bacterium]|nr:aldolase/citrate lyase family protein [Chloroflexota bacterium]